MRKNRKAVLAAAITGLAAYRLGAGQLGGASAPSAGGRDGARRSSTGVRRGAGGASPCSSDSRHRCARGGEHQNQGEFEQSVAHGLPSLSPQPYVRTQPP